MDESGTYLPLTETPSLRRCWLLQKAMECAPLDRALDIARSADAFITGASAELNVASDPVTTRACAGDTAVIGPSVIDEFDVEASQNGDATRAVAEINGAPIPVTELGTGSGQMGTPTTPLPSAAPTPQGTSNPAGLLILPERRQELMARMAKGASNAELAGEYGLSPRQVQGIRMVAARTSRKRPSFSRGAPNPVSSASPGLDEVVRYLRQQDDVVVPQGPGEFLLNGRFHMDTTELVSRANRMRSRQGKPAFQLNGQAPGTADAVRPSGGHPMFWNEPVAAHPQS